NIRDVLFGHGVSESSTKILQQNLTERGLTKHVDFNAHNQYITSLYKTGLIGLGLLIGLLIYCVKIGIATENKTLVYFTVLMSIAMLSESLFERASGTTFFGLLILLLINSKLPDKLHNVKKSFQQSF
ncbi:MAG: hypothetical protein EBU52_14565, partial [Cytophagia bacterium]|nr:hypothetical protein [Cytophagia bacterium]